MRHSNYGLDRVACDRKTGLDLATLSRSHMNLVSGRPLL